jgi:hypothetical protein
MKEVIWAFAILMIAACSKEKVDTINDNPDPDPTILHRLQNPLARNLLLVPGIGALLPTCLSCR